MLPPDHGPTTFLDGLRDELGASGVVTGRDADTYQVDLRNEYRGDAIAVIRPASTTETSAVVRHCAAHDVAIVTQGGNTGLAGGAIPLPGRTTVIISLTRMNRIRSVDADRHTITAEAGCTIEAVQDAASGAGRLFAPDWGARGTATIGGAISTDAGGINVLRYGTMRRHVLGLEAVLPDGRVWDGLRALRKDASGYDLKQLFIGAEGTLGIVTQAVLDLQPARPNQVLALAAVTDLDSLLVLHELARHHSDDGLTAFELIPEIGIARVVAAFPTIVRPLPSVSDWYALIRISSTRPTTDRMTDLLAEAAAAGLIADAVIAATADQVTNLWNLRDELSPTHLFPTIGQAIKLDSAVPIDGIRRYHQGIADIVRARAPGAVVYAFGHIGDGNLHTYVLPQPDGLRPFAAVRDDIVQRIDELTLELGGTLSAEHGVGQALRDRIWSQKPAIELELMQRIKRALDPDGLMNPGKLLPERAAT